ncbi:MAG: hypothetical protein HOV92_23260 [Streptomyces sp.]|nr:hypothetical protein [Streptomyces sp.]
MTAILPATTDNALVEHLARVARRAPMTVERRGEARLTRNVWSGGPVPTVGRSGPVGNSAQIRGEQ